MPRIGVERSSARALGACVGLAMALLASSCAKEAAEPPEPPRIRIDQGIVFEPTAGQLTFQGCGWKESRPLVDRTGGALNDARQSVGGGAGRELFVQLQMERHVALSLLAALPVGEGDWCKTLPPRGTTRASGNEPFWSVTIAPDAIEWNEPDLAAPLRFPAAEPAVDGTTRTWATSLDGRELRIVVSRGECRDSMSGAWFSSKADVTLDGRALTGCAYVAE